MEVDRFIKRFGMESKRREKRLFWTGFTMKDSAEIEMLFVQMGYHVMENWTDGYRVVAVNENLASIITYVEGDLHLEMFDNSAAYEWGFQKAADFYNGVHA